MKKYLLALLTASVFLSFSPLKAFEQKVIKGNGLEFWTETFGDPKDPALLLIMGSGGQGLLWPQMFCEQLANKGYFVIRFDNRDTGLSSPVDYQKSPYSLLDMAKDVVAILDAYNIEKAHVAGASMGGPIASLMAAHYPSRLHSLILIMTSPDFHPLFDALQKKSSKNSLSPPTSEYVVVVNKYLQDPPKTLDTKVKKWVVLQRMLNGDQAPFDVSYWNQLALQSFVRMRNEEGLNNHIKATQASFDLYREALRKITLPTLIIHGELDPVFPIDHAQALVKIIPHSQLKIIPGMGHTINSQFYGTLVNEMRWFRKP